MSKIIICISLVFLTSCSWINQKLGWEDDNLAEEAIEGVIQAETGVRVDLTPTSPESSK